MEFNDLPIDMGDYFRQHNPKFKFYDSYTIDCMIRSLYEDEEFKFRELISLLKAVKSMDFKCYQWILQKYNNVINVMRCQYRKFRAGTKEIINH